ncbi:MAG TPA: zf-HC2 domain-containing protein [Planctomycetota bacterium]|jgi:anti-sigma factor RsiW|nr:zf-HC2 domain-containing protein [Planctomycetota bacterium]
MACEAFGPDLSTYADGELEPSRAAAVERHLAHCPDCRSSLRTWRAAGESLRKEDPTPDRSDAFRAALPRAAPAAASRRRRRWLAPVAAGVALAAVLSFERARAARDAEAVVALEERNRTETIELLGAVESLRYDAAALLLRARAAEAGEAAGLEEDLRSLTESLRRLEGNLSRIRDGLDREGLLAGPTEAIDGTKNR